MDEQPILGRLLFLIAGVLCIVSRLLLGAPPAALVFGILFLAIAVSQYIDP